MREPAEVGSDNWPPPYDAAFAAPMQGTLRTILQAALDWVRA
jgi:formiminoglutamase